MEWPARSSVLVEVCKRLPAEQDGYEKQLENQMRGWLPQLRVPHTADLGSIAEAVLQTAQQIGGNTEWVNVTEGDASVVLGIEY